MINPQEVRKRIRATSLPANYDFEPTRGQKGAIIGTFNKTFGSDALRYLVCSWLFTDDLEPLRSKSMTNQQWFALLNWVEFGVIDGENVTGALFHDESVPVLNAALQAFVKADWSVQVLYDLDPLDYTVTAVELGGKIVEMGEDPENSPTPERKKQAPPLLAGTRFYAERRVFSPERQNQLLKELGYDVDDEQSIQF